MKSTTSRSDLPAASCSRIWLRRSTASGAFESAIVWFWHTRQRSSCARFVVRRSSAGSCAVANVNQNTSSALAARIQFLDERYHLLLHDLHSEGADVLVADDAFAIDDVGLGHAVDAVVDADAAVHVGDDQVIGIAVALEPGQRVLALVLVIQADHRRDAGARHLCDHRMLDQARRAPGGPDVHDPHLAEHLLLREALVGLDEQRQLEGRRGLADEGRWHLAGVEAQANREQGDQRDEDADDPAEPGHAVTASRARAGSATR